ncbi:MAG: hypothetical protein LUE29_03750, partial [Lachnospiraceae bacterium]|nr:hypothetical protein [Lachnospiraceae bacterium]
MRKKFFRRSLTLLLAVVMMMGSVLTVSAASTFSIRYEPDSYTKETTSYTQNLTLGLVAKLKPAVYTRTGYTQTAWGIGTSDDTSIMNAKDVTLLKLGGTVITATYYLSHNTTRMYLYPYWTANTYYVKYVDPVSGKSTKKTYTYDKSYSYPSSSTFTRSGYTLKGWS